MRRVLAALIVCAWMATSSPGAGQARVVRTPAAASVQQDTPNAFSPGEASSSALTTGLFSCMEAVDKNTAPTQPPLKKHVKLWYCACMMDAMYFAMTPAADIGATAQTCMTFAQSTRPATPATTATPYTGRSFLNSNQVAAAVLGCNKGLTKDPATKALPFAQRELYCSCLVDSMRVRRSLSTDVPAPVLRTCAATATVGPRAVVGRK